MPKERQTQKIPNGAVVPYKQAGSTYAINTGRPLFPKEPRKTRRLFSVPFYPMRRGKGTFPMYTVQRGWIDCAKRCRTWKLIDPNGQEVAEVTTKRAANVLADLLNGRDAR